MRELLRDVLFAVRVLSRRPIFTLGAVLSIALALAANVTIYSFTNKLLLNPLPLRDLSTLATVYTVEKGSPGLHGVSWPNYQDYRDNNQVFSDLAIYRPLMFELSGGGASPDLVRGEMVSGNYFRALGVEMARGRAFLDEEDATPGTHPVAVVSHRLWQSRYGGDPNLVGQTITLNNHGYTVVGIAERGFRGPYVLATSELWIPSMMYPEALSGRRLANFDNRRYVMLNMGGRLAPGVDLRQAEAEMKRLASNLESEYPKANENLTVAVGSMREGSIVPSLRQGFVLGSKALFVLVGLLLLIAVANVANLLLARALERRKEIAIRLSQGAGRGHLVRQLLVEGLVLSFVSGVAGCGLAWLGIELFWAIRPPMIPPTLDLSPDFSVVLFTFGLCVLTGVVFGLVPVLQASRANLVTALKDEMPQPFEGSRKLSLRNALVVAQVAFSLIALLGTATFLASLGRAYSLDLGFDTESTFVLSSDLGARGYDEPQIEGFQARLLERVGAVPGVRSAALAERAMLDLRATPSYDVTIVGQTRADDDPLDIRINTVSPGYFDTMGIGLLTGRDFGLGDHRDSRPVVVVNQTMAERAWPGESPIGQQLRISGVEEAYEVVAVAEDCSYQAVGEDSGYYMYRSHLQTLTPAMTLHVAAQADPATTMDTVRREAQALDPELPWIEESTMASLLDSSLWTTSLIAGLFSFFGLVSLVITLVGIYSVISLVISARRRELGIRMAIGAGRRQVLSLILGLGLTLALVGAVVGLVAGKLLTPLVGSLLYGVSGAGWLLDLGVVLALLVLASLASLAAARAILDIRPYEALRSQ